MSEHDDVEAICQLKARYFRMMDTKDWDGLAAVFTPDVVIDMSNEGGGVTRSVDEYIPFLRSNIEQVVTVHHGHMPEITLTSATSATGIWAMEDHLRWPEGSPIASLHGFGHYHETYRKTADGWRIAAMTLTRLRRDMEFAS
jgi:ketosteroid isomerase-like protein